MTVTRDDVNGIVGIVPTPATPDAAHWSATNTVNLPETSKMIDAIVSAGVDIVMTTGTFGECATLTWEELRDFVTCVIDTAAGRAPVFAGVTTLNTRDTIARGRALVDRGAAGLFIGRPMWLAMDQQQIVRFYADIAEALPKVPLVVYDNPSPFKGKISTEAYRQLAKIPEVVCAKHCGGPTLEADIVAVGGTRLRLLPIDAEWYDIALKHPDLVPACWSGNVACAPAPLVALSDAIKTRNWNEAERVTRQVQWALAKQFPGGDLATFMDYSIQIGHARFRTAGLIDPGPTRPPYVDAPESYIAGGEETGRRWAQLQREYVEAADAMKRRVATAR